MTFCPLLINKRWVYSENCIAKNSINLESNLKLLQIPMQILISILENIELFDMKLQSIYLLFEYILSLKLLIKL